MGEIQYLFCLSKIPVLFNQMICTVFSPLLMFPVVAVSIVIVNPNSNKHMLLFAQLRFVVVIIVTKMFPVVNWNKFPPSTKTTNFMMQQTSKTNFDIKPINDNKPLFSSERYLEHYDNNRNENLDLSLIAEEVIDYIMMPLIDAKVLHYLKCMNSQWKTKIEEYAEKSVPKFKFIAKFGTKGSGNGQFNGAFFVATDKQGNIHRIQMFDFNGQWLKSIGSCGSGNGQFDHPAGIAFNSKNHMFVADFNNHRIVQFDENMQFIKVFGSRGKGNGQLQYPCGITIDADDNIVVVDWINHRIQKFSKDGEWKQTIGKYGSGNGEFNRPWGVAVCKTSGKIFVSDYNHRIQVFSSDGKFLFQFGSYGSENGQFQYPRGLALSNCGQYLFVCDDLNHRIQLFNAMNGEFFKSYGSKGSNDGLFDGLFGICFSPSGQVIVSERDNNRVQIFE